MRKHYTLFPAAAILLFAACSKTEDAVPATKTVTFAAELSEAPQTKVAFAESTTSGNTTSYDIRWSSASETVSISYQKGDFASGTVTPSESDNKRATITASVTDDGSGNHNFYFVSPTSALQGNALTADVYPHALVTIPTEQNATEASPDPAAIILAAEVKGAGSFSNEETVTFKHMTAYLHFVISGLAENETVVKAVISDDNAYLSGGSSTNYIEFGTSNPSMKRQGGQKSITVNTSSNNIWASVFRGESYGNLTVALYTTSGEYTRTLALGQTKKLNAGQVARFNLSLNNFTRTATYGLLDEDFTDSAYGDLDWEVRNFTSGSVQGSYEYTSGSMVAKLGYQSSSSTKYRVNFICKEGKRTLHAGNYPIVAFRVTDPTRISDVTASVIKADIVGSCNGTNYGEWNNKSNAWAGKYDCYSDEEKQNYAGSVYYYNLQTQDIKNKNTSNWEFLPKNHPLECSIFDLWFVDIVSSSQPSLRMYWIKSFESVSALETYLATDPGTGKYTKIK